MRGLIAGVCVAGALLLTVASMYMNWSFWIGQGSDAASSQVTEGELVELMLEAYKMTRQNGDAFEHAPPLTKDVWDGVHEIARHLASPAAQVVEELVVHKIAELGLLPQKRASTN